MEPTRSLRPEVDRWDCAEPGCGAYGLPRTLFVPNIGVMMRNHQNDASRIDLRRECRCRKHAGPGWIAVTAAMPLVAQEQAVAAK